MRFDPLIDQFGADSSFDVAKASFYVSLRCPNQDMAAELFGFVEGALVVTTDLPTRQGQLIVSFQSNKEGVDSK